MTQIPQGNLGAKSDTAVLLNYTFREINGVYTSASRLAIPDDKVYNLENIIPVGPENAHVVDNISAPLFDFTTDNIYYARGLNLNGQEYLVCFAENGGVHLFNVATNVDTVINISNLLSGSGSRVDQWKNSVLLFIDQTGYYSYDGTNFNQITGPGVPSSGDDIAVYSGRVWIVQGRLLVNSGADDYTAPSFLVANGAAFKSLTDPQIRTKVQRMIVSNGVLYLVAGTSINAIYNVLIPQGAVPPTPTYQNDNIQAVIGSDEPASVISCDNSSFMMANKSGVYRVYGVQAPKISDDINGTWQYIDPSQDISAGTVVVKGLLCSAFLIKRLNDPVFGSNTIIALFTQRAAPSAIQSGEAVWWFANFGAISFIVTAISNENLSLYCFRGNILYKLFADPLTAPNAQVMTKLWEMEDALAMKEVMVSGFSAYLFLLGSSMTLTVDAPGQSFDTGVAVALTTGSWVNAFGQQGQWDNAINQVGGWFAPGPALTYSTSPAAGARNVGMTLSSVGYGYELNIMAMDYKLRQRWS